MRSKLAGLSALAALAVLAVMGGGAASASAAGITCAANSGTVKLSPGLTESAHVQNITIKGVLSECTSEESTLTEAKYVAHLKTTEAVTCSVLAGAGAEEEETKIVIKWRPKGQGNSQGTFSMPLTEATEVSLGGTLASGPFSEDTIAGTVSQAFTGGPTCGVTEGKKKAKKVKKGTFTGSAVTIQ